MTSVPTTAAHIVIESALPDGLGGTHLTFALKTGHWVNDHTGGLLERDTAYYPFDDITSSVYAYVFYEIVRLCPYLLSGSATFANVPHLNVFMLDLNRVIFGQLARRGRYLANQPPQVAAYIHIDDFSPMVDGSTLVDYTVKRGTPSRPQSHVGHLYRSRALFPHSVLTKWVYVFIIADLITFSPLVLSYADVLIAHNRDVEIALYDPDNIKLSPEQKQGGQALKQRGLYGRKKIFS
jgi:hypothetical protein